MGSGIRGRVRTSFSICVTSRTAGGAPCSLSGGSTLKLPPGPCPPLPYPGVGGVGLTGSCCERVDFEGDLFLPALKTSKGNIVNEITSECWISNEIRLLSTISPPLPMKDTLVFNTQSATQPRLDLKLVRTLWGKSETCKRLGPTLNSSRFVIAARLARERRAATQVWAPGETGRTLLP
jgi:hypothetical protein